MFVKKSSLVILLSFFVFISIIYAQSISISTLQNYSINATTYEFVFNVTSNVNSTLYYGTTSTDLEIDSWNKTFDGYNLQDKARAAAVDSNDNLYVVGEIQYKALTRAWWIKKFDSFGNEDFIWNRTFGDNTTDSVAYELAIDSSDNVYVVGYINNSVAVNSGRDWWIKRFDSFGTENLSWNKTFDGSLKTDIAYSVAIDNNDDVYVVGSSNNLTGTSSNDWWIKKFMANSSENTTAWNFMFNGTQNTNVPYDVEIDSSNNVYVAGYGNTLVGTSDDWWIKKFSSAGIEDTANWNITYDSGGADVIKSIAIDNLDNIYAVGFSGINWKIKKYASDGTEDAVNWDKTFSGGSSLATSVDTDSSNNVYVVGHGSNLVSGSSNEDLWLKKFASNGVEDTTYWNKTFDGSLQTDYSNGITIDSTDKIYVIGEGFDIISSSSQNDWWIKKFVAQPYTSTIKNTSFVNLTNITLTNLAVNTTYYYYLLLENTSNKNITSSEYTFTTIFADVVIPFYSANSTYPNTSKGYSTTHQFNVTWTEYDISRVWIEHNFTNNLTNYTVSSYISDKYYYNYGGIVPGNYIWRMHANDSNGFYNVTPWYNYEVLIGTSIINLTLNFTSNNVTIPIENYVYINATTIDGQVDLNLYIDGVLINSSSAILNNYSFWSEGLINVTIKHPQSENYTFSSQTLFANVTDIALNITINYPNNNSFTPYNPFVLNISTNKYAICEYKLINYTLDSSGYNNGGFIYGASWNHNGSIGGAYDFDGVDDNIEISYTTSLDITTNFTIIGWIKHNIGQNNNYPIFLEKFGSYSIYNVESGNYLQLQLNALNGNFYLNCGDNSTLNNTWQHYAFVVTNDGTSYCYINAEINNSNSISYTQINSTQSNICIGSKCDGTFALNGSVDNFMIYNRVLSFAEISSDYNGTIQTSGLVTHLSFNEDQYTLDSSGNSNTGYIHGATWTRDSSTNGAYDFDGIDDYIEIQNSDSLESNVDEFTMSVWIKPISYSAEAIILNKEGKYELALDSTGELKWAFNITEPAWNWMGTNASADLNEWTFVAVTYNGSKIKTYENYILKNTTNASGIIVATDFFEELRVGARNAPNNPTSLFNGTIDELRIYNRSLDLTEILALYNGTPSTTDLILYMPFNKTNLYNNSFSGNNFEFAKSITLAENQNYSIDVMCTDNYNNTAHAYLVDLKIDVTNPILNLNYPTSNLLFNTYLIELNFSVNETNTDKIWYEKNYLQTKYYLSIDNSEGINLENTTLSRPGKEYLILYINDSAGNIISDTVSFFINRTFNITNWTNDLNNLLSNVSEVAVLNQARSILSNNISLEQEITLQLNFTNISMEINNFSSSQTRWDFMFWAVDNSSYFINQTNYYIGTRPVDYFYAKNFSLFFSNSSDYFGKIVLPRNISYYDNIYYCSDETFDNCETISACSGVYFKTSTSACYNATSNNVNVFVPNIGSVFGDNDSISPTPTITSPINGSSVSSTYQIPLTFSVNEESTCSYRVNLGSFQSLGTNTLFSTAFNLYINSIQNITLNCTDSSGNLDSRYIYFTTNDISAPIISGLDIDDTKTTMDFIFSTNEPSNSSVTLVGNASSKTTTYGLTHEHNFTSLSQDTLYEYNITVCDIIGNCYSYFNEERTDSDSVSTGSTGTDTDTSGTGVLLASPKVQAIIALIKGQNVMDIASSKIALTKITFVLKEETNKTTVMTVEVRELPSNIPDADGVIYQYLRIYTSNLLDSEISGVTANFRVENVWFTTNDINSETVVLYRYTNNWDKLPTRKLSSGATYTNYEATSPGFSYYAISAQKNTHVIEVVQNNNSSENPPTGNVVDNSASNSNNLLGNDSSKRSYVGVIIFFILTGIIVVLIVGFFMYQQANVVSKDDDLKGLRKYISECKNLGASSEVIKTNLLTAGWDPGAVNVVLNEVNSYDVSAKPSESQSVFKGQNQNIERTNQINPTQVQQPNSQQQPLFDDEIRQLMNYILSTRKMGATDEMIRNQLQDSNWAKEAIENAFRNLL